MTETLLISDVHLSADYPDTVALFLRFCRDRAAEAESMYILGDLFDAWIGDDNDAPPYPDIRAALKALTDAGTSVNAQHGNRDFLLGERFCTQTGTELLPEEAVVELHNGLFRQQFCPGLCAETLAEQEVPVAVLGINRCARIGQGLQRSTDVRVGRGIVVVADPGIEEVAENVHGFGFGRAVAAETQEQRHCVGIIGRQVNVRNEQRLRHIPSMRGRRPEASPAVASADEFGLFDDDGLCRDVLVARPGGGRDLLDVVDHVHPLDDLAEDAVAPAVLPRMV